MYIYPKEKTTITVKFIPNYNYVNNRIGENIIKLAIGGVKNEASVSHIFFSYVYIDGKITTLNYGQQIKKALDSFMNGCYLNSEGLVLCECNHQKNHHSSLNEYYLTKDGDVVLPSETFEQTMDEFDYSISELEHKTDIVYQEAFNPFDISNQYYLQFDIDWILNGNFMKLNNFKLIEKEPLWSKGMDKNYILNMYNTAETIIECIKQYKKDNPTLFI